MQRLTFLFLILGLLLLTTNCAKENPWTSLEYLETKCSDPWKTIGGDSEAAVEMALLDYLKDDLMVPTSNLKITFDADAAESCEACSCTTGRKITIVVPNEFVAILEANGFVETKLID